MNTEKTIEKWKKFKEEVERPGWEETFLLKAFYVSNRSLDPQTQHGCVLVKENSPIKTGYNSFITNIDDSILPNLRPEKYPFMIHSEHNAILACAKTGVSCNGSTAYVTGPPCINCFQLMHQAGIVKIVYYAENKAHMTCNDEHDINFEILKKLSDIRVKVIPSCKKLDRKIELIKSLRNSEI